MTQRKVLIISYYWPPSGGVGVQRWVHFALNLQKMGWEPIVYTPANPQFEIQDENLAKKVAHIQTIKTNIWEPFQLFHKLTGNKNKGKVKQGLVLEKSKKSIKDDLIVWIRGNILIPDPRRFWKKPSVKFLSEYLIENNIDTVVTTGPPHSMHLIGLELKKKFPNLKWIADFRDPWSNWDVLPKLKTSNFSMSRHRKWEKEVLRNANISLTVSPTLAAQLAENAQTKVEVIYNGVESRKPDFKHEVKDKTKFAIGYFGLLNELRDPDSLWEGIKSTASNNTLFSETFELVLGGIISDSILDKLNGEEFFKDQIKNLGYLSHEEVFNAYQDCNLLILLLNKTDNAKWILPQKFFEYLTAGVPILAIGPPRSDLADIMQDQGLGCYADGNDKHQIETFILSIFEGNFEYNKKSAEDLLNRFSRKNQAKRLAKLIEEI